MFEEVCQSIPSCGRQLHRDRRRLIYCRFHVLCQRCTQGPCEIRCGHGASFQITGMVAEEVGSVPLVQDIARSQRDMPGEELRRIGLTS